MSGRAEALDKAAEVIEQNLQLLGATAVEDKLQDGVPDAIHTLQQAGIKVGALKLPKKTWTDSHVRFGCWLVIDKKLPSTSAFPLDSYPNLWIL